MHCHFVTAEEQLRSRIKVGRISGVFVFRAAPYHQFAEGTTLQTVQGEEGDLSVGH